MKKIFVILIVLCLTFSAYADIVLFDVGGGYHAGITPLEKSTTAISSVSLGATARLMFLDGVGLYLHGNIAFPQSIQSFADGNSVSTKPGYDVFLGYDTLIGVALMPVKTNSFGCFWHREFISVDCICQKQLLPVTLLDTKAQKQRLILVWV